MGDTLRKDTNSGRDPKLDTSCHVPDDAKRPDGQHVDHWVLPAEERAKGFVRPVRLSYVHVGIKGPDGPLRDLTNDERERFGDDYVKYEPYGPEKAPRKGKFWTQAQLASVGEGCRTVTSMPQAIAETYAREPGYYGSTFCCGCRKYLPVGKDGEFVWAGTNERVGT